MSTHENRSRGRKVLAARALKNLVITFHDELALVAVNRTVAVRRQKIQLGTARRQTTAIAVLCNCWNADCVDVA